MKMHCEFEPLICPTVATLKVGKRKKRKTLLSSLFFLFNFVLHLDFGGIGKWSWRKEEFFGGEWGFLVELGNGYEERMDFFWWVFFFFLEEAKWGNWGLFLILILMLGLRMDGWMERVRF